MIWTGWYYGLQIQIVDTTRTGRTRWVAMYLHLGCTVYYRVMNTQLATGHGLREGTYIEHTLYYITEWHELPHASQREWPQGGGPGHIGGRS